MKTPRLLTASALLLVLCACSHGNYRTDSRGVSVRTEAGTVRLEPVSGEIIRVTAVPAGARIAERQSLVTAYDSNNTVGGWSVSESDGIVTLLTQAMQVRVGLADGLVGFFDANGSPVATESARGFTPVEIRGKEAYELSLSFDSDPDEGLYGLGQHQSDEWNYKGRNESMYQYNTKVSVPFIVSTGGYGILWDNYSFSRFGNPRPYSDLCRLFTVTGKDGGEGLTATYMVGGDPDRVHTRRDETKIDYENLETVGNFPAGFPFQGSRITWDGSITAPESGTYHFILYYAGYITVYLDGRVIVPERWRTAWNPNSYKFTVEMKAGEKRDIKLDWRPDGGISYIGLKALSPRPAEERKRPAFWSEMGGMIDYYFIKGGNMDEVIGGYRTVTGKAQIMPRWAMGFWQSRQRYKTQEEVLETVNEYRRRGIPLDNIVQDWSYWPVDEWGSHNFEAGRFPDPEGMIDSVHAMDARIMISVWPKFYHTTDNYKAFAERGWMFDRAVRDSIRDFIAPGYIAGFYDAYSEGARKLFWDQMNEKLYSKGIDAWWMDASEPEIASNTNMDYRKELMNPTALGTADEYFNAYGLVNAQGIYEGQRSANPHDRVFILTRSGFAGQQRYSTATWSGDIGTRWEDMKAQISAGLNFALSGIPYWTMDIGGFCVEGRYQRAAEGSADMDEWRELNTRWFQFGAFCPLFRSHGEWPLREVYNIAPEGHPAYESMVYYDKLRYRLMPYIYSLAGKTHFDDYTIMRALVMDFAGDRNAMNIGDQYMFGPALMVCPVYEYKARAREVYLPAGGWYEFETGHYLQGERTVNADAPYGRMPMYVRAGAIVPTGHDIVSTVQPQHDLTLAIYAGADGEFAIYEDEGTNYNYEKGYFSTIPLTWNDAGRTLVIGERCGSYDGMPAEREFTVVLHTPDGRTQMRTAAYSGGKTAVRMTE